MRATYVIEVNAVGVRQVLLKKLLQTSCQGFGGVMRVDKVLDSLKLLVQLVRSLYIRNVIDETFPKMAADSSAVKTRSRCLTYKSV